MEDILKFADTLGRDPKDFLYPLPTRTQRFFSALAFPSTYVKAFDVSRYQESTEVNYTQAYAGGYRLVIIKATEGTTVLDPMFEWHWQHALDAGFYIMSYHFFSDGEDGTNQADWYLRNTQRMRDALLGRTASWNDNENRAGSPVITIATRRSKVLAWHNLVKQTVRKHGEYGSVSTWRTRMGDDLLSNYSADGWVAHWTSLSSPTLPTGWTESATKMWQTGVYPTYAWVEPVPGVLGTVDVDRWFGTEQSLKDYLGYSDPIPPQHAHPELESEINLLKSRVTSLENRFTNLESRTNNLQTNLAKSYTYFNVTADEAPCFETKKDNDVGKPIMSLYGEIGERIKYQKDQKIPVKPFSVDADGPVHFYKLINSPVQEELYLRATDGELS